jgi:hypothetical protein
MIFFLPSSSTITIFAAMVLLATIVFEGGYLRLAFD